MKEVLNMIMNKWEILHHDDIQNIAKGKTLYLTWQNEKDGPFCDTHTVTVLDPASLTDFLRKADNEGRYVLWMRVPPVPKPPEKYRILTPRVCVYSHIGTERCEYCDDGYCMHGPEDCPYATVRPEISVRG